MTDNDIPTPSCTGADCPPADDLKALLRGDTHDSGDVRLTAVTEHVGDCPGCQHRMDDLATAGAADLSAVVRHIDQSDPPRNSAYWDALNQVQGSLTLPFGSPHNGVDRDGRGADDGDGPGGSLADIQLDFLEPSTAPDSLGRIGAFEVRRVLGRGGMGVVLNGFDTHLRRDVALKILDPQLANNTTMRQRFCREARAAAAVSHDNLVAIYQVDEDTRSGLPFLIMQLVNGESLEQRLRRVGKLAPMEVARIGMQAAAGLASAHASGLIHRDIKPGNILIEAGSEKVRLTDFGLARAAEDMKLTRTGFVAGTPLYMAPEQARGDEIDARVDLFSLGSVLYEALAGVPAFDGKTPLAVLRRVTDETPTPVSRINPDVPDWLEDTIEGLLAKDPADRFQTAAEVAEIISTHLQASATGELSADRCLLTRSNTRLRRKRMQVCWKQVAVLAGLFVAGVLTGGLGAWAMIPPRTASTTLPQDKSGIGPLVSPAVDPGPTPKATLPAKSGAIWSVALSRDGGTLVMGIESGRISLWDVATQRLKFDLHPEHDDQAPAHKGPVWALDFTPDGEHLVSASDDGTIKVWDLTTGKQEKSIPVGTPVRAAAISPSGSWVAIGDRYGDVKVIDLMTDSPMFQYSQGSTVNGVAFSPDSLTVASVPANGPVVLYEVAGKRKRFSLDGHSGPVYGLSFSPDGRQLATASWDHTVVVWDLQTGNRLTTIDAHEEGVWAVQYSPNGELLATAGQDGTTKIWAVATGDLLATLGRHKGTVHTLKFDKDGKILATGGRDGTVRIWDVSTIRPNPPINPPRLSAGR